MLEYTIIRNYYPTGKEHPTEQLNDAAREGWRLVTAITPKDYAGGIMFIMEREKAE